jgi:hypothetical protein
VLLPLPIRTHGPRYGHVGGGEVQVDSGVGDVGGPEFSSKTELQAFSNISHLISSKGVIK